MKTWKLTSNFLNRKSFWHVKSMNIPSKNAWLQAWACLEQGFYDVIKAKYGWISHNHVSCESHTVESEFTAQIKQNTNIFTDFEISHLKNQSLWINLPYFILWVLLVLPWGQIPFSRKILIIKEKNLWWA